MYYYFIRKKIKIEMGGRDGVIVDYYFIRKKRKIEMDGRDAMKRQKQMIEIGSLLD